MKMTRSVAIAVLLTVAVAGWILSGQLGATNGPPAGSTATEEVASEQTRMSVRVADIAARPRPRRVVVNGQTEAFRLVEVRAETSGRVAEILARRGDFVEDGEILARLEMDDRQAKLDEAEALLRQREIEYRAAEQLQTKGFRSETSLAQAQAQRDAARAVVEQMQLDIERTTLRAPFEGIVGAGHVEVGDYLQVGDPAATIVDLDPMLVVGYATEREVDALEVGALGQARLLNGKEVQGIIGFVAPTADPSTRTYRFELEVENTDLAIRDGITSQIIIDTDAEPAHLISPSTLTLTDAGDVGVKTVNAEDRVVFRPVTILQDTPDGVWVSGLPDTVTLITVGQEFVIDGQLVRPVRESEISPPVGSIS